jgi:cysteine synthase
LKLTVTISTKVPEEKRNMLKFFGAEVIEIEDDL